jgi:BCD family chlorophyll transporter-like MFS transporter
MGGAMAARGRVMSGLPSFGWWQVLRLALVQACLGSVVVITTSTLNRIMVVELMMPALLPGLLVGLHYAVQMVRPRMGFGADQGRRCTPWMVGGMAVLSLGGCLAAQATVTMGSDRGLGVALAALAFALIGVGVSACGTSLLVLLAKRVPDERRAPAATLVWVMMIVGFALTAVVVGKHLDPYTPERMLNVVCTAAALAWLIACICLWGLEGPAQWAAQHGAAPGVDTALTHPAAPGTGEPMGPAQGAASVRFRQALAAVWDEPAARRFTIFVFLSMLAYSSQDLILEPFAGAVFDMTPGQTTQLSGLQHGGVLLGMLCVALAGSGWARGRWGSVQAWMVGGCLASALAMAGLSMAAGLGGSWPLLANVFLLGVANGAFSIAAITTMMRLAAAAKDGREGTRMGLWGASQAIAFGLGGLLGTGASDLARWWLSEPATAYSWVFGMEALMFAGSAWWAVQVGRSEAVQTRTTQTAPWAMEGQQP